MNDAYARMSDEELSRIFRAGDAEAHAAFAEIYARYSQKVYVFSLRMAGNPADADDIFQETFRRFFEHRTSETVNNLLSYLLRSARNIFLNSRRGSGRWSPFDEQEIADHVPLYEREELFNIINSALEVLDIPYREAFILRFYEGLSYKEISDITGDSVSALKVRVMRAKDQVRSILSPIIADLSRQ